MSLERPSWSQGLCPRPWNKKSIEIKGGFRALFETPAKAAYEGFAGARDHVPFAPWEALTETEQYVWVLVAKAACASFAGTAKFDEKQTHRVYFNDIELHPDTILSYDIEKQEVEVLLTVAKQISGVGPEHIPLLKSLTKIDEGVEANGNNYSTWNREFHSVKLTGKLSVHILDEAGEVIGTEDCTVILAR